MIQQIIKQKYWLCLTNKQHIYYKRKIRHNIGIEIMLFGMRQDIK